MSLMRPLRDIKKHIVQEVESQRVSFIAKLSQLRCRLIKLSSIWLMRDFSSHHPISFDFISLDIRRDKVKFIELRLNERDFSLRICKLFRGLSVQLLMEINRKIRNLFKIKNLSVSQD